MEGKASLNDVWKGSEIPLTRLLILPSTHPATDSTPEPWATQARFQAVDLQRVVLSSQDLQYSKRKKRNPHVLSATNIKTEGNRSVEHLIWGGGADENNHCHGLLKVKFDRGHSRPCGPVCKARLGSRAPRGSSG